MSNLTIRQLQELTRLEKRGAHGLWPHMNKSGWAADALLIAPGIATTLVEKGLAYRARGRLMKSDGAYTYAKYSLVVITDAGRAALVTDEPQEKLPGVVRVGDTIDVALYRCPNHDCHRMWIGGPIMCDSCGSETDGELIDYATVRVLKFVNHAEGM